MMLVTFLTALVIAGAVGGTGVFIVPLQQEFGWSTAEISSAISIRLILLEGGLHDRCHLRSLARRGPPGRLSCHRRLARDDLTRIDGFISVERFESLTEPGKLLSLSFWRDEQAVKAWRTRTRHREGQVKGRAGIFAEYRLRVASVLRDYGLDERAEVPADARALHGA